MALHPEVRALVDAMAANPDAKPTHELSPAEAREAYRAMAALLGPGEPVATVEERHVPGPAGPVPVRVYRPDGAGPHPILVFYHGGGWVIGDLDTHDRECRALCRGAGCIVVAVDYRRAPEHVFPAAVDDALAALRHVAAHAAELGGDPQRIAVGGDSAGGNLSAVVALEARDAGGPGLRMQLLVYPAVDLRAASDARYPSRSENAEGPFLLRETMDWFVGHYLGDDDAARADWRASPLLAASLADLPPAYVATAEHDPLRDEGEAYADALAAAGVPVRRRLFEGMPHVFFQLSPVVGAGRELLAEASAALRAAFDVDAGRRRSG
ncbi:MAG: alpha/beta hydrolase [Myxococcota bacterium]|nr:alpha/beta hydrolase [Myxococcota bacterium]